MVDNYLEGLTRRDALLGLGGLGAGAVAFGAGSAVAQMYGDDAENSSDDAPIDGNFGSGNVGNNGQSTDDSQDQDSSSNSEDANQDPVDNSESSDDSESPDNSENSDSNTDFVGSDDDQSNDSDTSDSSNDSDNGGEGLEDLDVDTSYSVNGEVEVDLENLDPVYEDSAVVMGVQSNGNLLAWNTEVENDDGYNPLWRFKSEDFPNREFFDVDGEHPLEEAYDELEADVDSLSEDMVKAFYNSEDEGSWEEHQDYKEINFEELRNGLVEYSDSGSAQDYFFNRMRTLEREEATLEEEWQQLLQDGL